MGGQLTRLAASPAHSLDLERGPGFLVRDHLMGSAASRWIDVVPFTWTRDRAGRLRHSGWRVRCPRHHPQAEETFLLEHHVLRCRHRDPPGNRGFCGKLLYVLYERDESRLLVAEIHSLDEIRLMQERHMSPQDVKAYLGIRVA